MKKSTGTLTIRNVPARIVRDLKMLARQRQQSMEQTVREILAQQVADRAAVLRQIESSRQELPRPVTIDEIVAWIRADRDSRDGE